MPLYSLRSRTATPTKVAIGGSSTASKSFTENTGYVDNPLVTVSANGVSFNPLGGTGTMAQALGNQLVTALQAPVRFLSTGVPGSGLSGWEASPSTLRAALTSGIVAMGGVDVCVIPVGFNDAAGQGVVSVNSHRDLLRSFHAKIRSETSLPNLPIIILGTQKLNTGGTAAVQAAWVRTAEAIVAGDANTYLIPTYTLDQLPDLIHQTIASYGITANCCAQAIIGLKTGVGVKKAPSVSATIPQSFTVTDVKLSHGSGNDISAAQALTGWLISSDGGATYSAPTSAVRVDQNTVRLTHASNGGNAQLVRYMDVGAPDVTGVLIDNTFPQSLPVLPSAPFAVTAPPGNPTPPANTSAPPAPTSTSNRAGQIFTGGTGGWTGSPTFAYQWYRGTISTPIAGATGLTYRATPADVGSALFYRVTGTNTVGSVSANSASTANVAAGLFTGDDFAGASGTALAGMTDDQGNAWSVIQGTVQLDGGGGAFCSAGGSMVAIDAFTPTTSEYDISGIIDVKSVTSQSWALSARVTDINNRLFAGYLTAAPTPGWSIGGVSGGTLTYYSGAAAYTPVTGQQQILFEVRDDRKTLYAGPVGGTLTKVAEVLTSAVPASNTITAIGKGGIRTAGTTDTTTTGAHWRAFRVSDPGV